MSAAKKEAEHKLHIGLNLLFIIPGQNGGTQVYSESLVKSLAALDQENMYTVFVSEEGAAMDLPEQSNFQKVVCPVHAVRREVRYAYEQIVFPRLVDRGGFDLLHSLGYVCPLHSPCPSVVTIHDLNYLTPWHGMSRSKRLFLGWFVGQSARHADRVLTVSQFSKEEIHRHLRVPESKITVTLEGPRTPTPLANDQWKDIAVRYGIRGSYLLAFGSITGNKNIACLLRAFASIHTQVPHTLLLVGHMTPGSELQAGIEGLGIADRINITGYVPDDHIMPLLKHADLFVFPSLYEGFGLPILEAQKAGVAVACSAASSLPEVAGDGAAFFDPASADEMARVMRKCLLDSAKRSALIEKGQANVARFSWKRTATETLACYRQVVAERKNYSHIEGK
ncbi:MAG: glycosyltransferase family 4 protein [Janthinobacterium lividum]